MNISTYFARVASPLYSNNGDASPIDSKNAVVNISTYFARVASPKDSKNAVVIITNL